MKRKILYSLISVLALMILLLIILDLTYYYEEKYRIKSVDVTLFKVTGKDTKTGCYELSDAVTLNDSNSVILVGVLYGFDFLSLEHEHLYDYVTAPPGSFGHVDTIESFQILDSTERVSLNTYIESAEEYKFFLSKDLKPSSNGYTGDGKGCFIAQTHNSIGEFVDSYNSGSKNSLIVNMKDYHFYKVKPEFTSSIIKNKLALKIKFSDSVTVESK